jgi:hypothetical protein
MSSAQWRRMTFNENLTILRHLPVEKPKIQIFCQGKEFQFSDEISQKFCVCENSFSLFLPRFVLVYIFCWVIQVAASIADLPKVKLLNMY